MATSGLVKKLGVRAGQTVVVLGAPARVSTALERHGELGRVSRQLRPAPVDCVVLFVERLIDLEMRIGRVTERLHPDGQIWVAWRSRRAVDVDEELVRRIGLTAGMVDTRVCALDAAWSGMRLVIRRENRDALAYRIGPPRRTRRASRAGEPELAGLVQPPSGPGSALAVARARRRT